jgi:hypothetical protein
MRLLSAPDMETVSSADWVVVEAVIREPVSVCRTGNFLHLSQKKGMRWGRGAAQCKFLQLFQHLNGVEPPFLLIR